MQTMPQSLNSREPCKENRKLKRAVITGGASFVGSHLVDALVLDGYYVIVLDNLSSGRLQNLSDSIDKIDFLEFDISTSSFDELVHIIKFTKPEIIFHLSAIHGGRGYISTHEADVLEDQIMNFRMFKIASELKIPVVYSSSACVYPTRLQEGRQNIHLTEDMLDLEHIESDESYGKSKAFAELQLQCFAKQYGLNSIALRFVTAYGPRENETHMLPAFCYKALCQQDPFEIIGDGETQRRDLTYVSDIVSGCMAAAKCLLDGRFKDGSDCRGYEAINLGTGQDYSTNEVAENTFRLLNWRPHEIKYLNDLPTGVDQRILDNTKACRLLGWLPEVQLSEGQRLTIEWMRSNTKYEIGKLRKERLWERTSV